MEKYCYPLDKDTIQPNEGWLFWQDI